MREVLASFKFEEILPEQLSVQEQAELFASASAVVGPHGAGLTNIVFCKPQTKVIELFAPSYRHSAYWMLANQSNLAEPPVGLGQFEWSCARSEAGENPIAVLDRPGSTS